MMEWFSLLQLTQNSTDQPSSNQRGTTIPPHDANGNTELGKGWTHTEWLPNSLLGISRWFPLYFLQDYSITLYLVITAEPVWKFFIHFMGLNKMGRRVVWKKKRIPKMKLSAETWGWNPSLAPIASDSEPPSGLPRVQVHLHTKPQSLQMTQRSVTYRFRKPWKLMGKRSVNVFFWAQIRCLKWFKTCPLLITRLKLVRSLFFPDASFTWFLTLE